jgi:hypothetical protein
MGTVGGEKTKTGHGMINMMSDDGDDDDDDGWR